MNLVFSDFNTTRDSLQRFYCILKHLFRAEAGWLANIPSFGQKFVLGRATYQDSVLLSQIQRRLQEMQCRHPENNASAELGHFGEIVAEAPSAAAFLMFATRKFRLRLIQAIDRHLAETDPLLNWPTQHLLKHARFDFQGVVDAAPAPALTAEDQAWLAYLDELFEFISQPATGSPPRRPLRNSDWQAPPFSEAAREPGFAITPALEVKRQLGLRSDPLSLERKDFINHAFELQFAESLGSIIFETPQMPWEFHADLARQLWDEMRHAEAGLRRCEQLGMPRSEVPQVNTNYGLRQTLDPLHRFCLMTLISEASGFPLKRERLKAYQAEGNVESERFMAFDLSDESAHVNFGHLWVPILIKQVSPGLSLEELKERCKAFVQGGSYNFDEQRFKKSPVFNS